MKIVNRIMKFGKALQVSHRLGPHHYPLSPPRQLVKNLSPLILSLMLAIVTITLGDTFWHRELAIKTITPATSQGVVVS